MKVNRSLAVLMLTLMMVINTSVAYAAPQILFTTNGAAKQYAPGAVLLVQGWVGEKGAGLSGIPGLVVVQNASNTIFTSQINTDTNGFFTTNFNLGPGNAAGDTVKISVNAANVTKEDSVNVSNQPKAFQFLGGSILLAGDKGTLTPQPIPGDIALVFNSNVNFFNDNSWPVAGLPSGVTSFLGLNERNQDCINLYNENTGQQVSAYVQVGNSESNYGQYYPLNSTEKTDKDILNNKVITDKNVLHLVTATALSPSTTYRIEIDKDLSANSSASLGQNQSVYFKTQTAVVPPTVPVSGGGSSTPATPAQDIATITTEGQQTLVVVDVQKALDIIGDKNITTLSIDLSAVKTGDTQQKSVQLPQEVVAAAQAENKDIVLQDAGLVIVIPADALAANQAVTISAQQLDVKNVPSPTSGFSNPTVYEFNAGQNGQLGYQFQQQVIITLPIPAGVTNPERLSVYCLNEATKQWEYVGGKVVEGKLVFQTGHFSKYMLAESTKTFKDIADHWAKNDIEVMIARQVVSGVSTDEFAPGRNITRAEFATLLTRALHLKPEWSDSGFGDVAQGDWYAAYVAQASKIGLIKGYAGQFRPNDQINRQEMCAMVMRAYSYKGGKVNNKNEVTYTDKGAISPWALEAVKSASSIGIIKGRGQGQLAPLENATRAEATVMLKSFMDVAGL